MKIDFSNNVNMPIDRSYNNTFVNFRQNKLIKNTKLDKSTVNSIQKISTLYDRILSIFTNLNGLGQNKFKSLYPNLLSGEKKKGLVFNSLTQNKENRLQIVRYNSKPNSDELLTFDLLNKENKNLVRYRVSKQGDVIISSNQPNFIEPKTCEKTVLNKVVKEFEELDIYSQNFREINKKISYNPQKSVKQVINLMRELPSETLKPEIIKTIETYNKLNKVLNKGKDAATLKKNYFGENTEKIKGLIYKNAGSGGLTYNFCPMQSKDDKRIFRVFIQDKNDKIQKSLLFFSDGKIAKIRDKATDLKDFRPHNIEFMNDKEVEQIGVKNILDILVNKFEDFENYIVQEKNAKKQIKSELKELKKQEKYIKSSKIEKLKVSPNIKQEKSVKKDGKNTKRIQEEQIKIKKLEKQIVESEKKAKNEGSYADLKIARQQKLAERRASINLEKLENKVDNVSQTLLKVSSGKLPEFTQLNITETINSLDNIFLRPVEERSPHLIHETLKNGNIFAGRFRFKATNGAMVIVKRVKSPTYVDLTYYSIDVEKQGQKFTMNLDPETNRIMRSTLDGKPIINGKHMVVYDSKKEFLEKNPEAKNIPLYLSEMFEIRNNVPRKTIKFVSTQSIKQQQEQKIIKEILSQDV